MKKKIIIVILILLTVVSLIYILIPSALPVGAKLSVSTTSAGANRFLLNKNEWQKWWPGTITRDSLFSFNNNQFSITSQTFNGIGVNVVNPKAELNGALILIPIKSDSLLIEWKYVITSGNNPIQKIKAFFTAKALSKDLTQILLKIKTVLEDEMFVYGVKINHEKVVDTLLLSSKLAYQKYPDLKDVYTLIDQLQKKLSDQRIEPVNPPMLHIRKIDSAYYETQVAIPILKWPTTDASTQIKRMVLGNILTATVQGGPATIKHAFRQVQQYVYDHGMAQPAIPYESLITNRILETDTTKWMTKLYFPVF